MSTTKSHALTIVPGSIAQYAAEQGISVAESFTNAAIIVIVDTSGSMAASDSRGHKTRYAVACEELATLQKNNPGKIAVISFSSDAMFCPGGVPHNYGQGTSVHLGLDFAKIADGLPSLKRIVLISDGEPDNRQAALDSAKTFKTKIDCIFVGPETEQAGRAFLNELAKASGGQSITSAAAQDLAGKVERLMLTAGAK